MPRRSDAPTMMTDAAKLVADLVTEAPPRAAVFERLGIEYCCGGKVPLVDACADKGLDVREVVLMLDEATAASPEDRDWSQASIDELVTDIVDTHHSYLRSEMPRVAMLAHKVARAHGESNPNLVAANREVECLIDELRTHLVAEEDDVFPICRQVAAGDVTEADDIASLLGSLVSEHTEVAEHLTRLRLLLDNYVPPAHACTSYRAYLDSLERLEQDIHRHVHKENHILFGKVMDLAYA